MYKIKVRTPKGQEFVKEYEAAAAADFYIQSSMILGRDVKLVEVSYSVWDLLEYFGSYLNDLETNAAADPEWDVENENIADMVCDFGTFPAELDYQDGISAARLAVAAWANDLVWLRG